MCVCRMGVGGRGDRGGTWAARWVAREVYVGKHGSGVVAILR